MPAMQMLHEVEPSQDLWNKLGDISKMEVFNNQVLVALYMRPTVTKSGIHLTEQHVAEDIYQSKVGLIVKVGANAFQDDKGAWFKFQKMNEGDWVVSRPSDGWSISVNKVPCRIIDDVNIKARVDHPDQIW